jgi:hypothetical protein
VVADPPLFVLLQEKVTSMEMKGLSQYRGIILIIMVIGRMRGEGGEEEEDLCQVHAWP